VVVDATVVEQLLPDCLRESEVRRVVTMQMADLAGTNFEGELAAPSWAGHDSRP
jgi:hypothetical protein